jgi:DNA-binding IclR family transcriptional regulator
VLFPVRAKGVAEQRRRTAQVSRLLHLLRAHGLIAKIPQAHRYRVTTKGEAVMSAAIYARYKVFPKELQHVA